MMNKLWVFGDSYSVPFSKIGSNDSWRRDYIIWKQYTPKCYGEVVSENLNLKHVNSAIGAADNYTILDSIIDVMYSISSDDIIIIGWSNTLRFRVANTNKNFTTIQPNNTTTAGVINYVKELSNTTLTELLINRDNSVYIDELNNYIKLLNFLFKKNKIIHWSPFGQDKDGLLTTCNSLNGLELIVKETNGEVNDTHFSENAHHQLTKHFLDILNNYKYPLYKKYV